MRIGKFLREIFLYKEPTKKLFLDQFRRILQSTTFLNDNERYQLLEIMKRDLHNETRTMLREVIVSDVFLGIMSEEEYNTVLLNINLFDDEEMTPEQWRVFMETKARMRAYEKIKGDQKEKS